MIRLLTLLFLFQSSLSFANELLPWPTNVLNAFLKTPQARSVVVKLDKPFSLLVFDQGSGNSVRVDRTSSPTQFLVNKKVLDLEKYHSPKELYDAVSSRVRQASAISFSMMAIAEAAEDTEVNNLNDALTAAIVTLIKATKTVDSCAPFFQFEKSCNDYADQLRDLLRNRVDAHTNASVLGANSGTVSELEYQTQMLAVFQKLDTMLSQVRAQAIGKYIDNAPYIQRCSCEQDGFATATCTANSAADLPALRDILACKTKLELMQKAEPIFKTAVDGLSSLIAPAALPPAPLITPPQVGVH